MLSFGSVSFCFQMMKNNFWPEFWDELLLDGLCYISSFCKVSQVVRAHRAEVIIALVLQTFSGDWMCHTVANHAWLDLCSLGYLKFPISGLLSGGNWATCISSPRFFSFFPYLSHVVPALDKKFSCWSCWWTEAQELLSALPKIPLRWEAKLLLISGTQCQTFTYKKKK